MEWIKIKHERYFRLFKENRDSLTCYSSCTDSDYALTEWGFTGVDLPFIKAIDTLDGLGEWEYRYYEYT